MAESYDIRRNILLRTPIDSLASQCATDHMAKEICASPLFWGDRYDRDGISRPKSLNYTVAQHILYYKSMLYLELIATGILIATVNVDLYDVDSFADPDLAALFIQVFAHQYQDITVIMRYRSGYHIDSGNMNEEDTGYEGTGVKKEDMIKFIQFLLVADIPINYIDISTDTQTETKVGKVYQYRAVI